VYFDEVQPFEHPQSSSTMGMFVRLSKEEKKRRRQQKKKRQLKRRRLCRLEL
jgi:hypothetical protein